MNITNNIILNNVNKVNEKSSDLYSDDSLIFKYLCKSAKYLTENTFSSVQISQNVSLASLGVEMLGGVENVQI